MENNYILPIISQLNAETPPPLNKVNIIFYNICNQGKVPFIQFILYKNLLGSLTLPTLEFSEPSNFIEEVQSLGKNCVESLIVNNYNTRDFEYKGWQEYENDIYVFVNFSSLSITNTYITDLDMYAFVSLSNIIQYGKYVFTPITLSICQYFKYFLDVFLLQDSKCEIQPVPVIGYSIQPWNACQFTNIFGITEVRDHAIRHYKLNRDFDELTKTFFNMNVDINHNISKYGLNIIAITGENSKFVCGELSLSEETFEDNDLILFNKDNICSVVFKNHLCQVPLSCYKLS